MKRFLSLLSLALIPLLVQAEETEIKGNRDFYGKHIIIAVDQKMKVQSSTDKLHAIRDVLKSILFNQNPSNSSSIEEVIEKNASQYPPSDFSFNPGQDELSLFSFGGVSQPTNKYPSPVAFDKDHINKIGSFGSSKLNLDNFISTKFDPLFSGDGKSGSSFSQLVFAPIIEKLDVSHYAKDYYIFIISDFMAGTTGLNSNYDLSRVNDWLTADCFRQYSKDYYYFNQQFYKTDFCTIKTFNTDRSGYASADNSILLAGFSIGLKALSGVSVSLGSTISLSQISFGGNTFEMNPQTLRFTRNGQLRVDRIVMSVEDENGNTIYNEAITDTTWEDKEKAYILGIPNNKITLGHYSEGDNLNFNYIIYATPLNDNNKALIPFAFCAPTQTFTFKASDFKAAPTRTNIVIGIAILLLAIFLYWLRYYRGRFVKARVQVKIDHISKQRYMNISANKDDDIHVTNAPCWYLRPGVNEQRIRVTCFMQRLPLRFAKRYRIKLSYMVKDLDENYDFTFRPEGNENDGNLRKADIWYVVPNSDLSNNVEFEFNAIAYVDHGKQPDFVGRENILKLGICLKAELVDNAGKVVKLLDEKNNVPYEFIAKEYFPNRELWMAFDPGTSGSCVAYGFGGTVVDKNNIHLARNFERHTDGFQGWVPIFPSKVRISDNSCLFENPKAVEDARIIQDGGDGDFWFGNAADQLWGRNSFQSIKKLLGYSNDLPIKRKGPQPVSQRIAGRDLAHLLIKGIINRFEKYLSDYSGGDNGTNDIKALEEVRSRFLSETGEFTPSRAIVTVPNNFTLVKILDMVESIRRTKLFKEVHFLYEAEGVLMTYLRDNWSNLKQKEGKVIVVFDMGGATINASAFSFDVTMQDFRGNQIVNDVTVRTVSRIGYGIGGDDIDYALVQILCSIPSVYNSIDCNKEKFMREHKPALLKYIKTLKLSYIDKRNDMIKSGNIVTDMETLWGSLRTNFQEWGVTLPENYAEDDELYLKKEHSTHKTMKKYVLNNVEDAVSELINSPNIQSKNVEVIFSGRSTLYPGVKEAVLKRLDKAGYSVTRWKGFDKPDSKEVVILDDEKVKSAVAVGACWYAMWSQFITIRHDIVTSTFGFIDLKDNKEVFHPVVQQGEGLVNGHRKHKVEVFDPTNPNILFVQMLGTNFDEIWKKKIYHKMNRIVQLTDIEGNVNTVEIDVDDRNNFKYLVTEMNGESHGGQDVIKDIDILDENSEAYIYAAYTSEEDANAIQDDKSLFASTASVKEPDLQPQRKPSSSTPNNRRGGGL